MHNNQKEFQPDTLRVQHAITLGLSGVFAGPEVTLALEYWQENTNLSVSVFKGINAFSRDVCKHLGKPELQRDLLKALNRALLNHDKIVVPELSVGSNPEDSPSVELDRSAPSGFPTPDFLSFGTLLQALLRRIEKLGAGSETSAKHFLMEVVEAMAWSEVQQQQIVNIIHGKTSVQQRGYKIDQLRVFFKHFKAWLAEEHGVKPAEKLISQAISDTQNTSAGKAFSVLHFVS